MSSAAAQRLECAICLDSCMNAVRLDCNHVFCYLCVKGSAQQSNNRCPVCRRPIPNDYFDNPILIDGIDWKAVPAAEGMQWQYEGRNGWWLYDSRTSRDIEKAFTANESTFEVLIAGFVYVIDFNQMIQFRRNQPNRIRKIKRNTIDPNAIKGVAGLRANFDDIQNLAADPSLSTTTLSNDSQCTQSADHSEENENIGSADESSTEPNGDHIVTHDIEEDIDQNIGSNDANISVNQLEEMFDQNLSLRDDIRETYL